VLFERARHLGPLEGRIAPLGHTRVFVVVETRRGARRTAPDRGEEARDERDANAAHDAHDAHIARLATRTPSDHVREISTTAVRPKVRWVRDPPPYAKPR